MRIWVALLLLSFSSICMAMDKPKSSDIPRGFGDSGQSGVSGGESSTPADGSITTSKLADNAVTGSKISAASNVTVGSLVANDGVSTTTLHGSNGVSLIGASSGSAFGIVPHPSTTAWTATMPTTAGTSGKVLSTDGTGVLSWVLATPADNSVTTAKLAANAVTAAKVDASTVPTLAANNAFTAFQTIRTSNGSGSIDGASLQGVGGISIPDQNGHYAKGVIKAGFYSIVSYYGSTDTGVLGALPGDTSPAFLKPDLSGYGDLKLNNLNALGYTRLSNVTTPDRPSGGALLYANSGSLCTINSSGTGGALIDTETDQTISGLKKFTNVSGVTFASSGSNAGIYVSSAAGGSGVNIRGDGVFIRNGNDLGFSMTSGYRDAGGIRPLGAHSLQLSTDFATPDTDLNLHDVISTGKVSAVGSVEMQTAAPLVIKSGANQRAGNATLVAGTATVSNTTVTSNTVIVLTTKTLGGTIGTLSYTLNAGTSFTINSANVLDTSTITYFLVEVN